MAYYRRKKFENLRPRNQKQIVYALLRKTMYSFLIASFFGVLLAFLYQEWVFLVLTVICLSFVAIFYALRFIRRRELARYYTIERLQALSPEDFEYYVVELLNHLGYHLRVVGGSGDEGIDGIGGDPRGRAMILQVKRYSDKNIVHTTLFREFVGTLAYHRVDLGVYVTTGYVSRGVREMVAKHSEKEIHIIDKDDLMRLIIKAYK
jgi:restriction system protein